MENLQNSQSGDKKEIVLAGVGNNASNIMKCLRRDIRLIFAIHYEHGKYIAFRQMIKNAGVVLITGYLGDRGFAKAANSVIKMAKEAGAITIAVVMAPFIFEGKISDKTAKENLKQLQYLCDSTIVIDNNQLLPIIGPKLGIKDSFELIDSLVIKVAKAVAGSVMGGDKDGINLNMTALKIILRCQGEGGIGIGEHQGENAAYKAMKTALLFPLIGDVSIKAVSGMIVHLTSHPEYNFADLNLVMKLVNDNVNENTDVTLGTTADENFPIDFIRVVIIVTLKEISCCKSINNTGMSPIN